MIGQLLEDIKTAPERIKTAPKRIATQPKNIARRARHRAYVMRGQGRERVWRASADTLEAIETFIGRAPENLPVLSKVADAAERLVHGQYEAFTRVSLEDYATMNAKEAIRIVVGLDHLELLRVQRFELATKNRKTVLSAIDKSIAQLFDPPVAVDQAA